MINDGSKTIHIDEVITYMCLAVDDYTSITIERRT
jgi:hypothetical protein